MPSCSCQSDSKITFLNYAKVELMGKIQKVKEDHKESLRKIRVILVEDKQKNKIFYSVMDKKLKEKKPQKSGTPHA